MRVWILKRKLMIMFCTRCTLMDICMGNLGHCTGRFWQFQVGTSTKQEVSDVTAIEVWLHGTICSYKLLNTFIYFFFFLFFFFFFWSLF